MGVQEFFLCWYELPYLLAKEFIELNQDDIREIWLRPKHD